MSEELDKAVQIKAALGQRKVELQTELAEMNAKVRGKSLPAKRYAEVVRRQQALKEEMMVVDKQIIGLKAEIHAMAQREHEAQPTPAGGRCDVIPTLVKLRDEYEEFAADATRVSSMRRMASEFAVKLTRIIREL